jgi:hypothetical protein
MWLNKLISLLFRLIIVSLIVLNHIYFLYYVWMPYTIHYHSAWVVIFFFHLILILTIWTLLVAGTSDPGQVPLYWGFYLGDTDQKRRRYCLMCNVFKPERTHHCSICNRCVLNMDHHCPWINNCIGFFNRKFFIQMLFYLNLSLCYILICNSKFTYEVVAKIFQNKDHFRTELRSKFWFLFIYSIDIVAFIITFLFFKMHLILVFENKTTIETIEKKGQKFQSEFSKGIYFNWTQVMGANKFLWFFPLKLYIGVAKGNGIDWNEGY